MNFFTGIERNHTFSILPNYENLNSFFVLYDLSYSFINLCNIYSIKKYYYNDFFKIYLDIQNILNSKNTSSIEYSYDYSHSEKVNGLPILPTLGIKGEF